MSHVQRETIKWFLASLTRLAGQYRCAIVCIRYPSKPEQSEGKVIHRSLVCSDLY
jgi:RecA-family ATPase